MNKETIVIVDGTNLVHRMYYVHKHLTDGKGLHTGAIYGFFKMILYYADKLNSNRFIICWEDKDGDIWRKQIYPEYKGNRMHGVSVNQKGLTEKEKDRIKKRKEIGESITAITKLAKTCGWIQIYKKNFEADDCIGYLVNKLKSNLKIISKDKDMMQFVNDDRKIRVVYPDEKMSYKLVNEKIVKEMFGVEPNKIVTLLALTGDDADHIKGIPKVGEKTALKLIKESKGKLSKVLTKEQNDIFERNKVLIDLTKTPITLDGMDLRFFSILQPEFLKEIKNELKTLKINSINPAQLLRISNKKLKKQVLQKIFIVGEEDA